MPPVFNFAWQGKMYLGKEQAGWKGYQHLHSRLSPMKGKSAGEILLVSKVCPPSLKRHLRRYGVPHWLQGVKPWALS